MDTDIEPYQLTLQSQNLDFQSDLSQFRNRPLICFVAPLLRSISRINSFIAWRHAECPVTCFKVSEVRTKVTWWVSLSDSSIGKLCYTMDCEFKIDELMRSQVIFRLKSIGALRYNFAGLIFSCINEGAKASNNIGVNYGVLGNNLPSPSRSIELLTMMKSDLVKIYDADPDILWLLSATKLRVSIMMSVLLQ